MMRRRGREDEFGEEVRVRGRMLEGRLCLSGWIWWAVEI